MNEEYTISPLGDSALLIYFRNKIDDAINKKVLSIFNRLQKLSLPEITDLIPAYSSLAICYDVAALHQKNATAFDTMKNLLEPILEAADGQSLFTTRQMKIPVCYAKVYAPDLEALAFDKNLLAEEVIGLHLAITYRVYMIGFLPGFAYMGKVDNRIATVRKTAPVNVAAGSVGIAGEQTGIYPFASPGGWNIIGRTPIKLFDKQNKEPVLLQPGDEITFYSISEDEFENYQGGPS
ncbi:MAG TPA: 5-oxoprolinase subunit PxpB [Flavisolibacter sp.]|jgi:inhibitor of KinA|nr:5-oxoprolinase subunit PxpB [Flavisolibacter sp.]